VITVIPLAGNSERFVKSGYLTPKPFLSLPDGRTIIETIVGTLDKNVDKIVTVAKADHKSMLHDSLESYPKWTFAAWTHSNTMGPLDSILYAEKFINYKEELLINFCDCWLPDDNGDQIAEFIESMHKRKLQAGVVCFPSNDPRFQRDPANKFAMSGIFWFKDGSRFVREALQYRDNPNVGPGHLAFMFHHWMISECGAFVTNNYVDLGIPESYEMYKALRSGKLVEIKK
jgi:molybdopterin-guanine dinucleotide biosynthesis protein A